MKKFSKVYAIYRGDKFIDVGTIKELSERQKLSKNTLHFYNSKAHINRIKNENNSIIVIKLED